MPSDDNPEVIRSDVLIIGAGLAGTSAAAVLARAGRSVTLVDIHAVYPPDFRAEKIGRPHVELFDRLGFGDTIRAATTPIDENWVFRFGRLMSRHAEREYGFAYEGLVNALRGALPDTVRFLVARVTGVETGPSLQTVALADGRRIEARLLVIATGLGDAVRRTAGIGRREIRRGHSLSLAFDLTRPAASYPFDTLNYFGHRPEDRVAYLTLFPIGETMRANFFVYRDVAEPWTKAFRQEPAAMLRAMLPGLEEACRGLDVAGPVQVRPIDLIQAENHRRDGVVVIGDAFATGCPAPGVGVRRVLTDVERLCVEHVPRWLATPGMDAAKIGQFYDDPVKRACDARSLRVSLYARSVAVDPGPVWAARRLRNAVVRRSLQIGRRAASGLAGALGGETADARAAP